MYAFYDKVAKAINYNKKKKTKQSICRYLGIGITGTRTKTIIIIACALKV